MKKSVGLIIGVIVIAILAFVTWQSSQTVSTPQASQSAGTTNNDSMAQASLTAEEVAMHDTSESCYTIVDGKVYDLTDWISKHPGGQQTIKEICGIDGSAAFRAQHGNSRQPNNVLDSYLIGELAN